MDLMDLIWVFLFKHHPTKVFEKQKVLRPNKFQKKNTTIRGFRSSMCFMCVQTRLGDFTCFFFRLERSFSGGNVWKHRVVAGC